MLAVNRDNQQSLFLGSSKIALLVKVPGQSDRDRFQVLD